jgi:glycosyltransferase involved in cell wall biosynthesis
VQSRILKYHNRDAEIIYPPVDTSLYRFREYGAFWLSVNRLYPEKQIDLQIESFSTMPEFKLLIVGSYAKGDHSTNYAKKIQNTIPPNVKFLGELNDSKLLDLYAHCRGLICTALDEDFGLTPLEAMASGKPVVAVDSGGFPETVTPSTGMLVQPDVISIATAIRHISKDPAQYHNACIARAKEFDIIVFEKKIRRLVDDITQ